jgi:hypothetical protein
MESFVIISITLIGFIFYELYWDSLKARRQEKKNLKSYRKLLNIDTNYYD